MKEKKEVKKKIKNQIKKKGIRTAKKVFDVFNFIIVILFIALAVYAIYNQQSLEITTLNGVQNYGFFALFIFNFILEFIPQLITPIFTYFPVIFLEMNIYFSVLIIVLGSILGSIAGFFVGRKFGYDVIEDFLGKNKCKIFVSFMDKYGRFAVFFAAITPLPYIPMIVGSLNLSKKNFILFGLIPRSVGLVIAGYLFHTGLFNL